MPIVVTSQERLPDRDERGCGSEDHRRSGHEAQRRSRSARQHPERRGRGGRACNAAANRSPLGVTAAMWRPMDI